MRAVADSRETVVEFRVRRRVYRLVLPQGRSTFEVDRLVRDECRRWVLRWTNYGVGMRLDGEVISTVRGVGAPMPPRVVAAITDCLRFVLYGPTTARKVYNA